jgi:PTH1 family peptidyl-tRNA hydrolase
MQAGQLRLLVGLGNPGDRYHGTRHNVGFMALEALARRNASAFRSMAKLQGQVAEIGFGPDRLRLLMPQTFMNESGRSIRAALDWFQFDVNQVLVVVDDMDLPLGRPMFSVASAKRSSRCWIR